MFAIMRKPGIFKCKFYFCKVKTAKNFSLPRKISQHKIAELKIRVKLPGLRRAERDLPL